MGLWRRYLDWRLRNVVRLVVTTAGFERRGRNQHSEICWDDVTQIHAFKRDLFTTDLLCLMFATSDAIVEISEDDTGFAELERSMEARFSLSPEWKLHVLCPAFEPRATLLYSETTL